MTQSIIQATTSRMNTPPGNATHIAATIAPATEPTDMIAGGVARKATMARPRLMDMPRAL